MRLYEECVAAGLGIALPNLVDLLRTGRNGAPVQRQRAQNYIHLGADLGIGAYERIVGNEYRDEGKLAKAIEMYERALAHKDDYAYYCLGKLYTFNGAMPLDLKKRSPIWRRALHGFQMMQASATCWEKSTSTAVRTFCLIMTKRLSC